MFELPTFKVGERVRVHNKPVEYSCPGCGREVGEGRNLENSFNAIIIKLDAPWSCRDCWHDGPTEGWHGVQLDDGTRFTAPYTLIEAIKEEQQC